MKRDYKTTILMLLVPTITIVFYLSVSYAGSFIDFNGNSYYRTDDGRIATNSWVWIDSDNDNIAECYRFLGDGTLAKNYTHYDGKKTNSDGQYVLNGDVVKKYMSNNKLVTDKDTLYGPNVNETETQKYYYSGSESNRKKLEYGLNYGSLANGIETHEDSTLINNIKETYNPFKDIKAETGVIYNKSDNSIAVSNNGKIISGFDARKYISASKKFEKEIDEVTVFNGDIWQDASVLKGNNSSVKFLPKKFNYMYFEYSDEDKEDFKYNTTDAELQIYVDGKLFEIIDDIIGSNSSFEEIDFTGNVPIEIKLVIKSGNYSENIYLRNIVFRRIKDD